MFRNDLSVFVIQYHVGSTSTGTANVVAASAKAALETWGGTQADVVSCVRLPGWGVTLPKEGGAS